MNSMSAESLEDRWCSSDVRRNIDAALLRTFVAFVDTGSLQRAADVVFRTQAAVSQQLKRLQETVGTQLFEKSGRRLVLTPAGQRMLIIAREFLRLHDDMLRWTCSAPLSGFELGGAENNSGGTDRFPSASGQDDGLDPVRLRRSVCKFEDNIVSLGQRRILQNWRERCASGLTTTIADLSKLGLLHRNRCLALLFRLEDSQFTCIDATDTEARDFNLDRYGFGISLDQMIGDNPVLAQRRRMYTACDQSGSPIFFSGNAVMPPGSEITDPRYMITALDRLVLPVQLDLGSKARGILIIGSWDESRSYEGIIERRAQSNEPHPTITERVILDV